MRHAERQIDLCVSASLLIETLKRVQGDDFILIWCKIVYKSIEFALDKCNVTSYNINMIKSFKHKGLEKFFLTGSTKGIQAIHQAKLNIMLTVLNKLTGLNDIPPSWRLHPLNGDLKGQWAVTVQANWRITFEFNEDTKDLYIVDYQDYH